MYNLIITIEDSEVQFQLIFKSQESVKAATEEVIKNLKQDSYITITDDYGHTISLSSIRVYAVLLTDVEAELEAQADRQIIQARSQHRLQQRMQTDPVLNMVTNTGRGGGMQ